MELTQRLECTQELYPKCSEKEFPDQIGFLGICGTKYPLKKGPNKIGRDPDTCNIILNLSSISRQHAVINILNNHEFMLMDLDSANKTKLSDKTLQAYIPHPLKNGDMVQFGQVFGVFRLFEEDNDLPMTQALDIPETPVQNRHVSKLNTVTTIPESPDVSDKEDSFIVPSQPKPREIFKSPNNNFIKTSGKTISIKPIGTNKIDNVYWSSSKKSDSFTLQSDTSNNDISIQSENNVPKPTSIHELETQVTDNHDDSVDSIYNANTQFIGDPPSPSIHSMETQVPTDLPEVCKIHEQHDVQINFTTDNKENDNNIFNAETQIEPVKDTPISKTDKTPIPLSTESTKDKNNVSDEEIVFDEVDCQPFEENFESQALLPPDIDVINNDKNAVPTEDVIESQEIRVVKSRTKTARRLLSDSSTDCEDDDINFAMTQKIAEINDDTTDCEEEPENNKTSEKDGKKAIDDDVTDCEDNEENDLIPQNKVIDINEMETQVLEEDTNIEQNKEANDRSSKEINLKDKPMDVKQEKNAPKLDEEPFEDLPTQILEEEPQKDVGFDEELTQKIYSQEMVPAFKVPKPSPSLSLKGKKKDVSGLKIVKQILSNEVKKPDESNNADEELYYAATQEIFQDLCSQREVSPEIVKIPTKPTLGKKDDVHEISISESVTNPFRQDSSDDVDIDEKLDNFVYSLSNSQIMDVVGIKKGSSGSSDPELTPKKLNPLTILNTKLPTTDEIKKYFNSPSKRNLKLSSESKSGNTISSPIKSSRNDQSKAKANLSKKFEDELIPTRVITRTRKPTAKMLNSDEKNLCDTILKSKFLTDKKADTNKETKEDDTIKSKKENTRKSKTKSDEKLNDKKAKDNTKDNKTNKHEETKRDKKKSDNETRKTKRSKDKVEPTKEPKNEKSNILYYLENTSRRTRSRSNQKAEAIEKKETEKNVIPTEDKVPEKKSNRTKNKAEKRDPTPEKELRRSRRQRSSKKSEDSLKSDSKTKTKSEESLKSDTKTTTKSEKTLKSVEKTKAKVSKDSHEKSTVYNTSSDSNMDSANKLKRSGTENFEVPSAKKSKTGTNAKNVSVRSTPARKVKTQYVLFTAFPCEEVKMKLEKLGAVIVSDVMQCTVVLTMQIKRTFKLLCAVGLGKPIVGPMWVQACADTNMIVDPWPYLIKDEQTEKRFQFNLERSLATRRNFLKGYNVSSTPNVMPNAQEMKLIVECSGGTWKAEGPNWICVSALPDKALWPALKKKGAIVVSTEFILAGVLGQRVEIDKNILE